MHPSPKGESRGNRETPHEGLGWFHPRGGRVEGIVNNTVL